MSRSIPKFLSFFPLRELLQNFTFMPGMETFNEHAIPVSNKITGWP